MLLGSVLLSEGTPADLPTQPLGQKGKLVLSDDFERTELCEAWKSVIPTVGVENGVLLGKQTRADHGSVAAAVASLPDGNLWFACKVRLLEKSTVGFGFDDKTCKDVHAGHIARVTLSQRQVTLYDDRQGVMRNDIYALRRSDDPQKKAEGNKLSAPHLARFPVKLEPNKWYDIGIEIVGDQMRVTLDGQVIGYLRSPGYCIPRRATYASTSTTAQPTSMR